jgi:hypothetical protein
MDAHVELKTRQFFWGLSTGIGILALAGAFWLMLAAASRASTWGPADRFPATVNGVALGEWSALIAIPALVILAAGIRMRRKAAGFSRRDLGRPELVDGARAIQRLFRWTSVAQFIGCALSGWLGTQFHREDLIWPAIALVVSLHFAPLGVVLRVRAYIATAVAGSLVAAMALFLPPSLLPPAGRFVVIGVGMGVVVWTTAAYAILRADRLALAWASGR